jgi:hypothetical protein
MQRSEVVRNTGTISNGIRTASASADRSDTAFAVAFVSVLRSLPIASRPGLGLGTVDFRGISPEVCP